MNELMNNGSLFQLNCPHCGEFIFFNPPETVSEATMVDSNIGRVKIHNLYSNRGTNRCYEAIDAEMICNSCHYTFKTTARRNFDI
ncbi:hypothetical protein [Romboutsia sp.]|uniref:hypothetical protein n=1 Tax=Romboutsia sp. TaxID=1965302 RepID=UPI003F37EAA2